MAAKTAPSEFAQPKQESTTRTSASKRVSKSELFTQVTPDNQTFMGATPSEADQDKLNRVMLGEEVAGVSKAHTLPTEGARLRQVFIEFPHHVLHMFKQLVIPTLVGSSALLWAGYVARTFAWRFPTALGLISVLEDQTAHMWTTPDLLMSLIGQWYGRLIYYVLTITALCTMFSYKLFLKPLLRILIPTAVAHLGFVTLHRILKLDDGCSPFDGITTIIQALILLCGLFTAFRLINRRVDPTNMYWSAGGLVVLGLLIMSGTVYAMFLWDRILESGDATKLVIGAIVNPLLFEILLFMSRVIVRMVPHCHESTITHFVTLTMSQKKMFGRFVIGMIRSPALVTVASIILGLAEVSFALTMSVRDKAIYRFTCARPNADADPLAAIKAKKLMRARNAHMETQLEMAFTILMSFVVPISYDLSIDGKHPDAGELLGSVAVQILIELVVDLVIVAWLTSKCRQPVMAVSPLSFRGTTVFLCVTIFWSCTFCNEMVLTSVAGTTGATESIFIYYVAEAFENVTATGVANCE